MLKLMKFRFEVHPAILFLQLQVMFPFAYDKTPIKSPLLDARHFEIIVTRTDLMMYYSFQGK